MADTPAHETVENLRCDEVFPEHEQRGAGSAEFEANRRQLIQKLQTPCFSCGSTEHLEVHHWVTEWALAEDADWNKVFKLVHHFDIYGFAAQLGDKPISGPDDIRNLVVLCVKCHRGAGVGIHLVPFPMWIGQVMAKDGTTVLKAPAK